MQLLITNHLELIEAAESFFRTAKQRCVDHENRPCYAKSVSGERCVIGDVLLPETDYELLWLRSFRGNAMGLLYGLFGVHPYTKLVEVAVEIQKLHDAEENWITGAGFTNWPAFFEIKEKYT
jgi:hypothetical protein